ncbi:MAG: sugar phosphate isomerase/epimerase [Bacteroidia bacterium]|nr:sugar phosphate isomerase/epimerase [Bacteroidia bacterium]
MAKLNRRKFIQQGTAASASLFLAGSTIACSTEKSSTQKEEKEMMVEVAPIAIQLWTIRELIEKDAKGSIMKLGEIGYQAVETAFFPDHISIAQGADMIKAAGLKVCSVHVEKPEGDERKRILEMAEAYDCQYMIWHGWPEEPKYKSLEGIRELADQFNEGNAFCKENGLKFGLHNHWWEFEPMEDGSLPFVKLRELLDEDIFFEIDTYWAKVAGQNPANIVGEFGERAAFLHIKDGPGVWNEAMDKDEPDPMVAVGQGAQNFPEIVKAAKGNTKWMIVELDNCATDMMTAVEESYAYLTQNNLAKGNV